MYRVLWFHFTILIKAPPCVNIVMKKGLCKNVHAGDYRSETVLNMPQISREELLGLQRTFPLYVRFPKSEWPKIKKCEGNGQEAEALYKELSREYTEKYL